MHQSLGNAPVSFDDPFQKSLHPSLHLSRLAVLTEPSVGVPTLRTSPNAMIKSIQSDEVNALENVI